MFFTYTNWKSAIHNRFCAPNQQYWSGVELALKKPWFIVTISQTESIEDGEEVLFRRDIFVPSFAEIEQLAQQEGDRLLKLDSVMIVIPNLINGMGAWTMEPLTAVWEADEPNAPGAPVEFCETQSGSKIMTTFGACRFEELTNHKLRYRFPIQ
jgi:hypothetical protein